jgi:quinol-cytochrome oxidoreductase complex cytochrome b subunit
MSVPFILPLLKSCSMLSIKEKLSNTLTTHPKLAMFGIGLAITFVVGTVVGMVETQQANALIAVCSNGSTMAGCRNH